MIDEEAAHRSKGRAAGLQAARDAFYKGDIAQKIARYHKDNGGWVTLEDLAAYEVSFEQPLRTTFHGVEVYACGPWTQGPMLPQTLNLLSGFDLKAMGHNSASYIHTLTEALKLSFADRHRYYGDPKFVKVPLDVLLSSEYADARRKLIRPDVAAPEMPAAGDIAGYTAARPLPGRNKGRPQSAAGHFLRLRRRPPWQRIFGHAQRRIECHAGDTGHRLVSVVARLAIVDRSRVSRRACARQAPSPHAQPGAGIKRRKLFMPFGSPGNDVQPQAMTQVFLNIVVFGMEPQAAVEAPRFATYSYPSSSAPHDYHPGRLNVESRVDKAVTDQLAKWGHKVAPWQDIEWRAGAVCAIRVNEDNGLLEGAADPRRPCYALGI